MFHWHRQPQWSECRSALQLSVRRAADTIQRMHWSFACFNNSRKPQTLIVSRIARTYGHPWTLKTNLIFDAMQLPPYRKRRTQAVRSQTASKALPPCHVLEQSSTAAITVDLICSKGAVGKTIGGWAGAWNSSNEFVATTWAEMQTSSEPTFVVQTSSGSQSVVPLRKMNFS